MLNEDYRGVSVGADAGIEFVLADRDPDGNPTSGLVRHRNSQWFKQSVHYVGSGGFWDAAWDPSRYLNIYLQKPQFDDPTKVLLGYAKYPWDASGTPTDGVVVLWNRWGDCEKYGDDAGDAGVARLESRFAQYASLIDKGFTSWAPDMAGGIADMRKAVDQVRCHLHAARERPCSHLPLLPRHTVQVIDSSRYFALRIDDGKGKHAFVGLGFRDRNLAYDFNATMQDHWKGVTRAKEAEELKAQLQAHGPRTHTPHMHMPSHMHLSRCACTCSCPAACTRRGRAPATVSANEKRSCTPAV